MKKPRKSSNKDSLQLMLNSAKCPSCDAINIVAAGNWEKYAPVECNSCNLLYWCGVFQSIETTATASFVEQIPELPEGTVVILVNREHLLHLNSGIIINRDHQFYRIDFNGKKMWFPSNLIVKIPDSI